VITANDGPTITFPDGREIAAAGKKLRYYLNRFNRFSGYDGISPRSRDIITDQDRQLANKLAARRDLKCWAPLVGQSIEKVDSVWDLFRLSDQEYENARVVAKAVLNPFLTHRGIGVPALTKGLHRKRPNFIPVCDRVLLHIFRIEPDMKNPETAIACMDKLREVGTANLGSLEKLASTSGSLGQPPTSLRILDAITWLEWGPFREQMIVHMIAPDKSIAVHIEGGPGSSTSASERPTIDFICDECGRPWERKRGGPRPWHCAHCAGELRKQGRGPVQRLSALTSG
jgi:hypothetical protein